MTTIVRGINDKPVASDALAKYFEDWGEEGHLFIGYPILGSPDGKQTIDAVFVSPDKGVVLFDLVDGSNVDGYEDRQDEVATLMQSKLMAYKDLVHRRTLMVNIATITFAPAFRRRQDVGGGGRLRSITLPEIKRRYGLR